jgi:hypothetical protein
MVAPQLLRTTYLRSVHVSFELILVQEIYLRSQPSLANDVLLPSAILRLVLLVDRRI